MVKKATKAAAVAAPAAANGEPKPKKPRNKEIRYWVFGTLTNQQGRDEDVCLAVLPTIGKASKWFRDNMLGYQRFYRDMRICRVTPVQPRPPKTRTAKAAE